MRVLGYPPGWCRQAEIQPNLNIIGDEQANKPAEAGVEDGEIQPIIYDESATIEYPGYNAHFPKHVKDESLHLFHLFHYFLLSISFFLSLSFSFSL